MCLNDDGVISFLNIPYPTRTISTRSRSNLPNNYHITWLVVNSDHAGLTEFIFRQTATNYRLFQYTDKPSKRLCTNSLLKRVNYSWVCNTIGNQNPFPIAAHHDAYRISLIVNHIGFFSSPQVSWKLETMIRHLTLMQPTPSVTSWCSFERE